MDQPPSRLKCKTSFFYKRISDCVLDVGNGILEIWVSPWSYQRPLKERDEYGKLSENSRQNFMQLSEILLHLVYCNFQHSILQSLKRESINSEGTSYRWNDGLCSELWMNLSSDLDWQRYVEEIFELNLVRRLFNRKCNKLWTCWHSSASDLTKRRQQSGAENWENLLGPIAVRLSW